METRTRSGRVVKKPKLYTPDEVVEDDYNESDYDSDNECSDVESIRTEDESDYDGADDKTMISMDSLCRTRMRMRTRNRCAHLKH